MASNPEFSKKASLATPFSSIDQIPPYLICTKCNDVAINCLQSQHGCRLCQACVVKWQKSCQESKLCPCASNDCPDKISHLSDRSLSLNISTWVPDLGTRREVNRLAVWCPNRDKGCPHQCMWKDVDKHLNGSCQFEMSKCNLCYKDVVQYQLNSIHKDLLSDVCCDAFFSTCPHCKAPEQLNRRRFQIHLELPCPLRPEACIYAPMGCQTTASKDEMKKHYKENCDYHLQLMDAKHNQQIKTITDQVDEMLKIINDRIQRSQLTESHSKCDMRNGTMSNGVTHTRAAGTPLPEIAANSELPGSDQPELLVEDDNDHRRANAFTALAAKQLNMFIDGVECQTILVKMFEASPELLRKRNQIGDNPMAAALRNQMADRAEILVDVAAKVNPEALSDRSHNQGETLLMLSAHLKDETAGCRLIGRFLELDPTRLYLCNMDGRNLLHICAVKNTSLLLEETLRLARQLLQTGKLEVGALEKAVSKKDRWGKSPRDLLAAGKMCKMQNLLQAFLDELRLGVVPGHKDQLDKELPDNQRGTGTDHGLLNNRTYSI